MLYSSCTLDLKQSKRSNQLKPAQFSTDELISTHGNSESAQILRVSPDAKTHIWQIPEDKKK